MGMPRNPLVSIGGLLIRRRESSKCHRLKDLEARLYLRSGLPLKNNDQDERMNRCRDFG